METNKTRKYDSVRAKTSLIKKTNEVDKEIMNLMIYGTTRWKPTDLDYEY